jgi:uncharacterized protein
VNAAKFYKANVLVLGGDITGKMLIPFVRQGDGSFVTDYGAKKRVVRKLKELEELMVEAADAGYYPCVVDPKELEEMRTDPARVRELFVEQMKKGLKRWLSLAEERLRGTGVSCYISPGNDDYFEIDEILDSSAFTVNPEGKVVSIDGEHEMITLGFANRTPWNSPREVDEQVLGEKIEAMASGVRDMRRAIFNLHVPPIDTPLDQAAKLDDDFKPVVSGGTILMIGAGSVAVRRSIERHQPLAGLHGHIHESRGTVKIGKTMCFNPGSDYGNGLLRGVLMDVEGDAIRTSLLTAG